MLRVVVAVAMVVSVMFVGVTAISESAQQTEPHLNSSSQNASYDLATGVFGGMSEASSGAVVLGGIAAVVLVSLGILLQAGRSGGR